MKANYPNEEEGYEQLIEEDTTAVEWHTGQCYEDEAAKQIKCKKCGGNKFYVAQGNFWTGIKCPTCNYEIMIDEG